MASQPYSLHQCAVDAEAALEKLATEMAHAGIDKNTVAVVTKMAGVTRKIVSVLGQGQEQTGDTEGPAEEAAPTEEPDQQQPQDMHSAAQALHQHMMAARAARGR